MNKTGHLIGTFLAVLLLTACGGQADKVLTPSGMNMQRGRNYKEVIEDFQDKGFKNIRTEPIEDLRFGWTARNGEVEQISVGGDTDYDAGVWVSPETEVVIRYHTFQTQIGEEQAAEEEAEAGGQLDSAKAAEKKQDEGAGAEASGIEEKEAGAGGQSDPAKAAEKKKEESEEKSGDKSEEKSKDKSEEKSKDKSEKKTEDKSEDKSEEKQEKKTEDKSEE